MNYRQLTGVLGILMSVFLPDLVFAKGHILVSDIDDTLKLTNVRSYQDLAVNGLFGNQVFLGMSELYQEWINHDEDPNSVMYLSRSPDALFSDLDHLLFSEKGFPWGRFRLLSLFDFASFEDFKVLSIRKLLTEDERPLVLVGDDAQNDPQVFSRVLQSEKISSCYIHQVRGVKLPLGVIPFVTAFDLALHEVEAGRLHAKQAARVGQVILDSDQPEDLFPSFKVCPAEYSYHMGGNLGLGPVASADPDLVAMALQVKTYIQFLCKHRK